VNPAERLARRADSYQQRHAWLAFPVAAWKKFGDDQAGNLAALIAYYAFVSLFPLMLVLVTVLDIMLRGNTALRQRVVTAVGSYPVIGPQLKGVHPLQETGIALVIGLVLTFLGARGVANAAQNALNSAWLVPFASRPGFPLNQIRSIALILVVGLGEIATIILSGFAGSAGHVLGGAAGRIGAIVVSLVLNVLLFWAGFRLATASAVSTRELRLGAVIAAIAWQALQLLGGYFLTHSLHRSSALYGVFGVVLGLLAWLYLQAQLTLYAVEINVVKARRLWPRSLVPPPLTPQDVTAYQLYAQAERRRQDIDIEVRPDQHDLAGRRDQPDLAGRRDQHDHAGRPDQHDHAGRPDKPRQPGRPGQPGQAGR